MERVDIEELTKDETEFDEPILYRVVMLNDDYTPMDFVVNILMEIFHKSYDDAVDIMMTIHKQNRSICGVYPFDIAEAKTVQVKKIARERSYPLRAIVEEDK